jgi:hypothetical protein
MNTPTIGYHAFVYHGMEDEPVPKQESERLFCDWSLHARVIVLERRFAIERAACERLEREKRQLKAGCLGLAICAFTGLLVALVEVLWSRR